MARRPRDIRLLDTELSDLPPAARWREWMARVEAVIFASATPVTRQTLARLVGRECSIDLIIEDIRAELSGRPYDIVAVAGGWQHRTRPAFAPVIAAAAGFDAGIEQAIELSQQESALLIAIGYFQPITRTELSQIFGKEVSRDAIAQLRQAGFIGSGPRSPTPGAPYTYVTTPKFLSAFGFDTLRELPDLEMLEDSGLLSRRPPPDDPSMPVAGESDSDDDRADEDDRPDQE